MMTTTRLTQTDETREVEPLRSAPLGGSGVPEQVLLAPWGNVESANGSFVVDDESARLVVEAFENHGTDLPIDYEHQTLGGPYASPSGTAPAAGWVKHIEAKAGVGLVANIEWTGKATEMLASKAYRYLSPVAVIRKTDRKLVAIHSAALTNKPAIVGMEPIVHRATTAGTPDDVEPLALLRNELDVKADASATEVLIAASERIVTLERDAKLHRTGQRVREAVEAGKLVEAQRSWAEALVEREESLFEEWFRTAPVVVARGCCVPVGGGDVAERHQRSLTTRARSEFRANRLLGALTSEEAFIADTLRQAERC